MGPTGYSADGEVRPAWKTEKFTLEISARMDRIDPFALPKFDCCIFRTGPGTAHIAEDTNVPHPPQRLQTVVSWEAVHVAYDACVVCGDALVYVYDESE